MTENNDFINLQVSLLNFLDKYKDIPGMDEESMPSLFDEISLDDDVLFDMTIMGKLTFDLSHPKFSDEEFFKRILQHYTTMEAYEKCSALLSQKKDRQLN
jgi:hypothetical protein